MFGIVVLHITSLSTNEIGRYLTPKEILQKGSRPHVGRYCCPARGTVTTFSVRVCISYSDSDVIYTHIHTRAIEGLRGFAKGLRPFELRSLLVIKAIFHSTRASEWHSTIQAPVPNII